MRDMVTRFNVDIQQSVHSPLSITGLRSRSYGSQLRVIQEISREENSFRSFLVSYQSDGLTVFGRINLPSGEIPPQGFPVVVFAHGFSPDPLEPNYFQRPYYETWINAYADAGFAVIMPGYRGHGIIDGDKADGSEYIDKYADLYLSSPFYAIDVLNMIAGLSTISSCGGGGLRDDPEIENCLDDENIFLSAHSMGGDVALAVLAVEGSFRAASIWAGVCADIRDVAEFYTAYEASERTLDEPLERLFNEKWRMVEAAAKKTPFLIDDINALNGLFYLDNLAAPIILHHGTRDTAVPDEWSVNFHQKLEELGKESKLHLYEGNNHELSLNNQHLVALERDLTFFNKNIKK
jgi:uncharacterized protein